MYTLRRRTARVVVLDDEDRVLLIRGSDPTNPAAGPWWEIPGGGIEGIEASETAAARELYEETGITDAQMGPCVWTHHTTFTFAGIFFDQHERIHVARVHGGAAEERAYRPAHLEALEAMAFHGAQWWPVGDLAELADRGERFIPGWLPTQVPLVVAGGLPDSIIDMGEQ